MNNSGLVIKKYNEVMIMRKEGAKPKLLRYMKAHAGEWVPRSVLNEIAEGVGSWERALRTVRDDGYILEYDKSTNCYRFPFAEPKNEPKDSRYISKKLRAMVLIRDNSTCKMCGKSVQKDGIKVHIDHITPLEWGGKTEMDNLQVLCSECNEGKKNYVENESPELMCEISQARSTEERLRLYFEYYKNTIVDVDKLAVIGKTREWTRQLRYIRKDYDMDFQYIPRNKKKQINKDGYIYHDPSRKTKKKS